MTLRLGRTSLLLVLVGVLTAGCGAGVTGPVVTGQNPAAALTGLKPPLPFGGRRNLIPDGSFENSPGIASADGITPWVPFENSTLFLVQSGTTRFGRTALAVRVLPARVAPTAGRQFGAEASFGFGQPVEGSRFRLTVWIEGDRGLWGNPVEVELQAVSANARPSTIAKRQTQLKPGWQPVAVEGAVTKSADYLRAVVSVQNSTRPPTPNLYLDGVTAFQVGS